MFGPLLYCWWRMPNVFSLVATAASGSSRRQSGFEEKNHAVRSDANMSGDMYSAIRLVVSFVIKWQAEIFHDFFIAVN